MPRYSSGLEFTWHVAAMGALAGNHELILPAHLVMGLCLLDLRPSEMELTPEVLDDIKAEGDVVRGVFLQVGVDARTLFEALKQDVGEGGVTDETRKVVSRTPASKAAFARAERLAGENREVTALDLMAALADEPASPAMQPLAKLGVDVNRLKSVALLAAQTSAATSVLAKYGKDLTALARDGRLQECIGRRDEMLRIVQTLQRHTKNNPLLVGEAGVGKTAIVEGLAWRVAQGRSLPGKRVVQINVADLVAGAKYRGEFEERWQGLLREAAASPDVVLFIDEIHTVVGAGDRAGGLDAANLLKPALARGELRLIGATTRDEFGRSIEKDPALERRFQPIAVAEPSAEETLAILTQGYLKRFQEQHHVMIEAAAIDAAVALSDRYLPDRRLPDKAIDLLDEACARVSTPVLSVGPGTSPSNPGVVGSDAVARVVAEWRGIPVGQLNDDQRDRLLGMSDDLKRRVVGQDAACDALSQAVRRARAGLRPANKPQGVFLFIGPTGVGKTELAKATAAFLFGSEDSLVRIDLSEYGERHTVARLIGSPPGYIGHDEEGQLTGSLRRKPYCVVLLDEVEKAHPEVLNLFLQLFDDARLTDGQGRVADASQALFIMTSNVGHGPNMGFAVPQTDEQANLLLAEVRKTFSPEFLNRLDDVLLFNFLSRADAVRIIRLMLASLAARLRTQGVLGLETTEAAVELLAAEGHDEMFGARELRRTLERLVEDPIAGMLLRQQLGAGHYVVVDADKGRLTCDVVGGVTQ